MSASENSAIIQPSRCPLSKPIIIKHKSSKNVPPKGRRTPLIFPESLYMLLYPVADCLKCDRCNRFFDFGVFSEGAGIGGLEEVVESG